MKKYDLVVGLEVHVQLATESKLFTPDLNRYGDAPNTNVGPITLAHPGTLPKLNVKAVDFAIMMGLACHCQIASTCTFDRKNYFYPDLPKGYQITQDQYPICKEGYVPVTTELGRRKIRLNKIHLEEDAGKSLHDMQSNSTLVDYNRAGAPLIEIVTEPDFHHVEEVSAFLTQIRKMVRFLGISDGNMEQGSLRCDVNISLKPVGSPVLGQKVEIKNMNSIRNVQQAIKYEIERQTNILNQDQVPLQETRGYDDDRGITIGQREKEDANDYRYFTDPDLPSVHISEDKLVQIKKAMPKLHHEFLAEFIEKFGLPAYDAEILTDTKDIATFYVNLVRCTTHYKAAANWTIGPIKGYINETGTTFINFPVSVEVLARIIEMVETGTLSFSIASTRLLPKVIDHPSDDPKQLAETMGLLQDNNQDFLMEAVRQVIEAHPGKVEAYKKGKKGLKGMFMGEIMKQTSGRANPKLADQLLEETLNNITE